MFKRLSPTLYEPKLIITLSNQLVIRKHLIALGGLPSGPYSANSLGAICIQSALLTSSSNVRHVHAYCMCQCQAFAAQGLVLCSQQKNTQREQRSRTERHNKADTMVDVGPDTE